MNEPPNTGLEAETDGRDPLGVPSTASLFRSASLPFVFLRMCVYLALAEGAGYALQGISRFIFSGELYSSLPRGLLFGVSIGLVSAFAAACVMSRFEGRRVGEYGLPVRRAFGKLFWQGAFFGLIEISTVLGVIAALGGYRFGEVAIHGSILWRWAILWAVVFLA